MTTRYLLDVNVLVALVDDEHVHHLQATTWFNTAGLQWALCAFSEAGLLRYATRLKTKGVGMMNASAMLTQLTDRPGYKYQSVDSDWKSLTEPFAQRIFGHNQITDAYLLGLAVRDGLVLVTFDKGILHLAGEYSHHVLLLEA